MSGEVEHEGVVKEIKGDTLFVSIISKSACVSCSIKDACNISDVAEKIIEVNRHGIDYSLGEKVKVSLQEETGMKAFFLAYMVPLFLVIFAMISASYFFEEEWKIGLVSLLILVPYYFLLNALKGKFKSQFSFFVYKI